MSGRRITSFCTCVLRNVTPVHIFFIRNKERIWASTESVLKLPDLECLEFLMSFIKGSIKIFMFATCALKNISKQCFKPLPNVLDRAIFSYLDYFRNGSILIIFVEIHGKVYKNQNHCKS